MNGMTLNTKTPHSHLHRSILVVTMLAACMVVWGFAAAAAGTPASSPASASATSRPATQAAATRPAASIRADGVILIDGKPFFPIGMYHDSLDADYYGPKFLHDLKTIADAGFNLAHVSMDFTNDGDTPAESIAGQAARLAQDNHMYLAGAVYLKNLPVVVAEQARWPAILMASLGDDFNSDAKGRFQGPPKFPPDRLRSLHEQAKRVAPSLLTYSSGSSYRGAPLAGYESAVDCLAVQCYPIGDGSQSRANELEAMDDVVANYWKAAGSGANKALIVNLQAFSHDGRRWPSPQEVRLQAWVSLLNQAKGLMWYSFLTSKPAGKTLPQANPAVWGELKLLVPELKRVVPFLTDGRLTLVANPADAAFDDGPGTWHGGYWTLGSTCLVVIVSTHRTKTLNVDIAIPGAKALVRLFDSPRYGETLDTQTPGHMKGAIAPASVQVYVTAEASK